MSRTSYEHLIYLQFRSCVNWEDNSFSNSMGKDKSFGPFYVIQTNYKLVDEINKCYARLDSSYYLQRLTNSNRSAQKLFYKLLQWLLMVCLLSLLKRWSILFYNTSARHEQHECNMKHERHECDTNDTSATQARHERHKCNTSATRATRVWHQCYTNDTSVTRRRNFDFDNATSENIFSHPYISYLLNERLQGEEQFHSKNCLLEMPRSHTKMHLKSAPQKQKFVMAKAISKSCSCMFPHSYA